MPGSRSTLLGRRLGLGCTHRRLTARRAFASAFEPLEVRQMFCILHDGNFGWTDPNSLVSIAEGRTRLGLENGLTPPKSLSALTASPTSDATGLPQLNSNPGAPVDIYLDFDGDNSGGAQMVTPYDTNGDPNTFDAAEQATVQQSWALVTTYFAMFNVNVTTAAPTKPFAWVAIGNNVNGGYSYVGVFPQNTGGTPESFVASQFAASRASGIAHEIGHNFGLNHQADWSPLGTLVNEYSSGYDEQHGPIMGVDYAQKVHHWQFGHPSFSPTFEQDDLAIIAGRIAAQPGGGDGYRPDDFGGTVGTATPMTVSGVDQTKSGIIERTGDVDVHSFTSTGGRYLITADPQAESAVDLKLEIRDASNNLVAAEDLSASNDAQVAVNLPAGTYYAVVSSHGNYAELGQYTVSASPIADNFDSSDISATLNKRAGNSSYDPSTGVYSVTGGGNDVWNSADQFRYTYEQLSGDGSITARVASLDRTGTFAKAGVMIRESLLAGARHAMVNFRADNAVEFIRRTVADAAAVSDVNYGLNVPVWVRLTRAGSTFTAERSADGVAWTTIGTATIAMGVNIYIGLAVCSNNEPVTATGTFDHVSITGNVGPTAYANNGLAAPTNLSVAVGTGSGLNLSWTGVAGATGYIVERSSDGQNFTQVGGSGSAQFTFTDPNLPGSNRYFYRVSAIGSASGRSPVSNVATAINRPSAVTNVTTMSILTTQIQIDWRDTLGESGFRVERSIGGLIWTPLTTVGANVTGYTDNSVAASSNYSYRIVALSALGDSSPSTAVLEGSRLAVVANVKGVKSTSSSATITWTDLNKVETGYRIERSTDDTTWTLLTNVGGNVVTYTDNTVSPLTKYYYRVTATSPYTEGISGGVGLIATQPTSTQLPPTGWGGIDIGTVGGPGANGYDAATGTHTIISSGADVWNTADEFHFEYRTMTGDGEIIAKVATEDNADQYTKAGVMFRESLAANSRYAFANMTPRNTGVQFERRTATGGNPASNNGFGGSLPIWVKLTRVGNLITGYQSVDGVNWTSMGSDTVPMSTTIYVGLALTSHNDSLLAAATFTDVSGSAVTQTDTAAPAAPTIVMSTDTGTSATDHITGDNTLLFNGTAEPGTTVTVRRNGILVSTIPITYQGTWTYDQTLLPLDDGTYVYDITATDVSGNTSVSSPFTVVVDTTAPTVATATFNRETGHRWSVTFSEDVTGSLAASDFTIVNTLTNVAYTPLMSYDATSHTASLSLFGNALLPDGRYELRLSAGAVNDLAGNFLATPLASPFNVLAGDVDGSGTVDFNDLLVIAAAYNTTGKTFSQGNLDYDAAGKVDFNDLLMLAKSYNNTLPPAASPTLATASATRKRTDATFASSVIA